MNHPTAIENLADAQQELISVLAMRARGTATLARQFEATERVEYAKAGFYAFLGDTQKSIQHSTIARAIRTSIDDGSLEGLN